MAIPATGAIIGTPPSINASVDAQTEPIEVEPFDAKHSDTNRIVYGKSSCDGSTLRNAFSASAPCPISRRFGLPIRPTSPVEYGGKL